MKKMTKTFRIIVDGTKTKMKIQTKKWNRNQRYFSPDDIERIS